MLDTFVDGAAYRWDYVGGQVYNVRKLGFDLTVTPGVYSVVQTNSTGAGRRIRVSIVSGTTTEQLLDLSIATANGYVTALSFPGLDGTTRTMPASAIESTYKLNQPVDATGRATTTIWYEDRSVQSGDPIGSNVEFTVAPDQACLSVRDYHSRAGNPVAWCWSGDLSRGSVTRWGDLTGTGVQNFPFINGGIGLNPPAPATAGATPPALRSSYPVGSMLKAAFDYSFQTDSSRFGYPAAIRQTQAVTPPVTTVGPSLDCSQLPSMYTSAGCQLFPAYYISYQMNAADTSSMRIDAVGSAMNDVSGARCSAIGPGGGTPAMSLGQTQSIQTCRGNSFSGGLTTAWGGVGSPASASDRPVLLSLLPSDKEAGKMLLCLTFPAELHNVLTKYCPRFTYDGVLDTTKVPWIDEGAVEVVRYPVGQGIVNAVNATWTQDFTLSRFWPTPIAQSVARPRSTIDTYEMAINNSAWNTYQRSIYTGPPAGATFLPGGFQFALNFQHSPISVIGFQYFGDGFGFGCASQAAYTSILPPGQPQMDSQALAIGESATIGKCVASGAPDFSNRTWYFTFTLAAWQSKYSDRYIACIHVDDDRNGILPAPPSTANGMFCPRFFKATNALDKSKVPWERE